MTTPGHRDGTEEEQQSAMRAAGPYLTLGIQLALTIVVLFFIGRLLDAQFSTSPWLMITALFVGCTGGLIKFIRTVNTLSKQDDERAGKKN
ncbi:MAG TPA: AtpZ/AtpI family protein [Bacteroidota bacterium]|nr:AtpZ/AtpI family protein [Bacteroidota bacterium]